MNWQEVVYGAVAVTGLIEWIKSFDKERKLKKYYKFLPLFLSIIPAIFLSHLNNFSWYLVGLLWMGIFSFSILGYQTIIETIEKKIKL